VPLSEADIAVGDAPALAFARKPTYHAVQDSPDPFSPSADRLESQRVINANLFAALRAIDTPD